MSIPVPVRYDRLQKGLVDAINAAFDAPAPQISWAKGHAVFEATPSEGLIDLDIVSGPETHTRQRGNLRPFCPHEDYTLEFSAPTSGDLVWLELNDYRYRYDTQPGDTAEDVRDGMLALLVDDAEPEGVYADVSTDRLSITPATLGDIFQIAWSPNISLFDRTAQTAQAYVQHERSWVFTLQVQAFSKAATPRAGALALISRVIAALQTTDVRRELKQQGVALWNIGTPSDISATVGGYWESRQTVDITLALAANWTRPENIIETAEFTANLA